MLDMHTFSSKQFDTVDSQPIQGSVFADSRVEGDRVICKKIC